MKQQYLSIRSEFCWLLIAAISAALVSLSISFEAGALSVLFMAVAWWTWQYPENGLLLLLTILPVLPMFKITQTIGLVTIVKDIIIFTLFLRTFLWPLATQQLPYRRNIFFLPVVGLVIWTIVGVLRANDLLLGILRAREITLYILLFFGVLYLPHSWARMQTRVWLLAYGLTVTLLLGVYQWFFAFDSSVLRFDPLRQVWIPRLSSILGHPSVYGQYLISITTMLVAYLATSPRRLEKTSLSILVLLSLPAIVLTYSRAVWLGFFISALTIISFLLWQYFQRYAINRRQAIHPKKLTLRPSRRLLAIFLILAIAVIFAFQTMPITNYVWSFLDPAYKSNAIRLDFLTRLIGSLSNTDAMIGKGLGDVLEQNFRSADLALIDVTTGASRSIQLAKDSTLVDNQYLKTWVEMGLVGILIYGWLYLTALLGIRSLSVSPERSTDSRLVKFAQWWLASFLAAFVIQAFFIDIWDIFPTNAFFWLAAAILAAAQTPSTKPV